MAANRDVIYHLSMFFIISMILFPLKRSLLIILMLLIPPLIEIVQFFIPGRVPDFMDAFHGYLGILLAYCLIQMWREIWPAVKKFRLHFESKKFQNQGNMR
jgi:VanZ family protein